MKSLFFLLLTLVLLGDLMAQNVGINNTDPQTALDVDGKFRIRPNGFDVSGGGTITIPNPSPGYFSLSGSPTAEFTVNLPSGVKGTFLILENATTGGYTCNVPGLTKILPGKSKLFLYGDMGWILAHDSDLSQLEKITEGGNTGWRIAGRNPANYGDIGINAVDLSTANNSTLPYGATGTTSFAANSHGIASGFSSATFNSSTRAFGTSTSAMGLATHATSFASLAIGCNNDTIAGSSRTMWVPTDPIFMIGNSYLGAPSNALLVRKNGNTDINGNTLANGNLDVILDTKINQNLLVKQSANVESKLTVGFNGTGNSTVETKSFGARFESITADLTLTDEHHTIRVGPGLSTNPTITLPSAASVKYRIYYIVNHSDKDVPVKPGFVDLNWTTSVSDPTIVPQKTAVTLQSDGNEWYRIQ